MSADGYDGRTKIERRKQKPKDECHDEIEHGLPLRKRNEHNRPARNAPARSFVRSLKLPRGLDLYKPLKIVDFRLSHMVSTASTEPTLNGFSTKKLQIPVR